MKKQGTHDPKSQKKALAAYGKATYKDGLKTSIKRVANDGAK